MDDPAHGLTDELLHQVPRAFSPDGGESAVIGFDSPLGGIRFALEYLESVRQRRHQTPVPSGEGSALVSYHQLADAATPTDPAPAAADEVLISEALRHHPDVAEAPGLTFVPVERRVRQAFGDKQAGDTIRCFQVRT
ncbi:MAG: hypothetical protein IT369_05860 [Candidatus Latescibacteria bacterium]|nr:hypothetical protein [Candidatus Latescibacterota bacterium]